MTLIQSIKVAFYKRFRPEQIRSLGVRRAILLGLPDGTQFLEVDEYAQVEPTGYVPQPLPMPQGSVVPLDYGERPYAQTDSGSAFMASPELEDQYEAQQKAEDPLGLRNAFTITPN